MLYLNVCVIFTCTEYKTFLYTEGKLLFFFVVVEVVTAATQHFYCVLFYKDHISTAQAFERQNQTCCTLVLFSKENNSRWFTKAVAKSIPKSFE